GASRYPRHQGQVSVGPQGLSDARGQSWGFALLPKARSRSSLELTLTTARSRLKSQAGGRLKSGLRQGRAIVYRILPSLSASKTRELAAGTHRRHGRIRGPA